MLDAQLVQRFGDQLGAHEGAGGDDEHGRVRQLQALGRDRGPEVDLVADDEVGPPLGAEGEDAPGPLARVATRKAIAQGPILPRGVGLEQGEPPRRAEGVSPRGEAGEPRGRDHRKHHRLAREGDGVARGRGGAGNRDQRLEMAAAAREREEDAHGVPLLDRLRTAPHRRRFHAVDRRARSGDHGAGSRPNDTHRFRTPTGAGSNAARPRCAGPTAD